MQRFSLGLGIAKLAGNRFLGHHVNGVINQQSRQSSNGLIQITNLCLDTNHLTTIEIQILLRFLGGFFNQRFGIVEDRIKSTSQIRFQQILPNSYLAMARLRSLTLAGAAGVVSIFAFAILGFPTIEHLSALSAKQVAGEGTQLIKPTSFMAMTFPRESYQTLCE